MEIIIGRKGEQPFVITDKSVSGKHLKLTTMTDGKVLVEDLNSKNGTFIDGIRIVKKLVERNTLVRMGSTYSFLISDAIPSASDAHRQSVVSQNNNVPNNNHVPHNSNNVSPEYDLESIRKFELLENVWNNYFQTKIRLQKDNASKGFMRMMPLFVLGGLGYLISCIPVLAEFRTIITFAGIGIGVVITWHSYQSATHLPEQMEKLNQQFQIDYVCPHCKQFLGFTPFEGLKNKGQCMVCKTKWVKK